MNKSFQNKLLFFFLHLKCLMLTKSCFTWTSSALWIFSEEAHSKWCCVVPSRAVLEDLAHGPGPVCSLVRCDDPGQHLPGCFCLQKCQVCAQTQVSIKKKKK